MLALANKLTTSTQPIYRFVNKYSIDFDGVDDRIITDGADTVAQPTTYSFWSKSSTTASNLGVFGHGDERQGGFHFNFLQAATYKPLLWLGNSYYVFWNDISQQDDGEWHHWVIYSDTNNLNNCKLYCDGVLQTVNVVVTSGSLMAYTESLTIGSDEQVGGNSFEGKIDEFAVYDRELTQAEITRMYNTYYSPNRIANGNFSQIGNEEVTNGDFSQIGSEQANYSDNNIVFNNSSDSTTISLGSNSYRSEAFGNTGDDRPRVTINGSGIVTGKTYKVVYTPTSFTGSTVFDFFENNTRIINNHDASLPKTFYFVASDTLDAFVFDGSETFMSDYTLSIKEVGQDWSFGTGWSMGDGLAECDGTQSTFSYLTQTGLSLSDKLYQIKFSVTRSSGALRPQFVGGTSSVESSDIQSSGEYTLYMQLASNTTFRFRANSSFVGSIDNISVKEVGQHWTFGTGWSTDGTKAIASAGTQSNLTTVNNPLTVGTTVKITYTISDYVAGTSKVFFGGGLAGTVRNANGTYTETNVVTTNGSFLIQKSSDGDFSIDNIVVQELKHDATNLMLNAGDYQAASDLQNYYRMGDGILDGYPLIADQTNPSLGNELVTNGDFTTDSDWTKGTGWTIANNLANFNGSGFSAFRQSVGLITGKIYKVTFDLNITSGNVIFQLGGATNTFDSSATHTFYDTATTNGAYSTFISLYSSTSSIFSIDNVSVKQVNGSPGIMTNMSASDIIEDTPNEPN